VVIGFKPIHFSGSDFFISPHSKTSNPWNAVHGLYNKYIDHSPQPRTFVTIVVKREPILILFYCLKAHPLGWVGCIFLGGYGFPSSAVDGLNKHLIEPPYISQRPED